MATRAVPSARRAAAHRAHAVFYRTAVAKWLNQEKAAEFRLYRFCRPRGAPSRHRRRFRRTTATSRRLRPHAPELPGDGVTEVGPPEHWPKAIAFARATVAGQRSARRRTLGICPGRTKSSQEICQCYVRPGSKSATRVTRFSEFLKCSSDRQFLFFWSAFNRGGVVRRWRGTLKTPSASLGRIFFSVFN